MKILFLAPQPFFQERGTPIAVRLAVQVLASRGGDTIDLLTYHEGEAIDIPNVELHRISMPSWVSDIPPGISVKKVLCDLMFMFCTFRLVWRNRSEHYDLVHAVEESVFIAALVRLFFGIPYIYDMDSSLVLQLTDKWRFLKVFTPVLSLFEKVAVKFSAAVVPMCDALEVVAKQYGASDTMILRDISLLDLDGAGAVNLPALRDEAKIPADSSVVLYIGNLEFYQGIDLLIEAYSTIDCPDAHIVIIGGSEGDIARYREKAASLGIASNVHLLGPRAVASLAHYLQQANILVSPRTKGNNTPMKIYSYLHSKVPILATDLPTHTQVLDSNVSVLAEPEPKQFGKALSKLVDNPTLQQTLAKNAFDLAEREYTFEVFSSRLNQLYDTLGEKILGTSVKA